MTTEKHSSRRSLNLIHSNGTQFNVKVSYYVSTNYVGVYSKGGFSGQEKTLEDKLQRLYIYYAPITKTRGQELASVYYKNDSLWLKLIHVDGTLFEVKAGYYMSTKYVRIYSNGGFPSEKATSEFKLKTADGIKLHRLKKQGKWEDIIDSKATFIKYLEVSSFEPQFFQLLQFFHTLLHSKPFA